MITIPEVVEEIICHSSFLEEGLYKGIVNYSALARIIKPEIESRLFKSIKEGAIIMALRRISKNNKLNHNFKKIFSNAPDMIVRSNLVEFTFLNSESLSTKLKELFSETENQNQYFFTVTQGVFETGIITSKELESKIKSIFKEKIIRTLLDLSSITIKLPEENVTTPGVYYFILKILAWQNINVIEVVSTYQEITLVLETKNIDTAFSALKKSLTLLQ